MNILIKTHGSIGSPIIKVLKYGGNLFKSLTEAVPTQNRHSVIGYLMTFSISSPYNVIIDNGMVDN